MPVYICCIKDSRRTLQLFGRQGERSDVFPSSTRKHLLRLNFQRYVHVSLTLSGCRTLQCQRLHYSHGTVASSSSEGRHIPADGEAAGATSASPGWSCRTWRSSPSVVEEGGQQDHQSLSRHQLWLRVAPCGASCSPSSCLSIVCVCLVFCFMATQQLGNHQHHHQSFPTSPPPPQQQLNKSQASFSHHFTIPRMPLWYQCITQFTL